VAGSGPWWVEHGDVAAQWVSTASSCLCGLPDHWRLQTPIVKKLSLLQNLPVSVLTRWDYSITLKIKGKNILLFAARCWNAFCSMVGE
jgi:hypothetical protein